MQIAYALLSLLSDGKFHSGTALAQHLKVSRASIWKGIAFLRRLSVPIQAISGRGYRWYEPMELLCKEKIFSLVDPSTQSHISKIEVLKVVASTNDYLLQQLKRGLPPGALCVAEGQSAGRGRMGRRWHSPLGANIYLSFYWRFPNKLYDLSGVSLVVACALLESLKKITILPPGLGIKWPNDIWYHGAKLGGILIESANNHAAKTIDFTDMVIGVGVNVAMPWQENHSQWTDLTQVIGSVPSRNTLIAYFLNALIPLLIRFQQEGFAPFHPLWLQYDLLRGKTVKLTTLNQQEEGIAQGVNERGELFVKVGEQLKAVRYGEVSVK